MSCACCGSTPRLSAVPLAPHPVRLARSALTCTAVVGLVCAVALADSCGDSASAPCNSTASDPGEGFGVDEVRMRCSPAALNPALGVGRAGPGRWHRTIPPLCAMAVMHSARLPLRRNVHVSHIMQRTSGTCPLPARWRRPVQLRCRRVPTCTCEAARPEPVGAAHAGRLSCHYALIPPSVRLHSNIIGWLAVIGGRSGTQSGTSRSRPN